MSKFSFHSRTNFWTSFYWNFKFRIVLQPRSGKKLFLTCCKTKISRKYRFHNSREVIKSLFHCFIYDDAELWPPNFFFFAREKNAVYLKKSRLRDKIFRFFIDFLCRKEMSQTRYRHNNLFWWKLYPLSRSKNKKNE